MGRLLSSGPALTLYMLVICAGSYFTTAKGFEQYLAGAPDSLVWSMSAAFQLLIFVCSIKVANSTLGWMTRVGAAVIFTVCLSISSLGSFLYFDNIFTVAQRRKVATESYCEQVKQYVLTTKEIVSQTITAYKKILPSLERAIAHEDGGGVVSRKGSGKGPMWDLLNERKEILQSTVAPYQTFWEESRAVCHTSDFSSLLTDETCKGTLDCVRLQVKALPTAKQLQEEITPTMALLQKREYAAELGTPIVPEIPDPIDTLKFSSPITGSLFERISGAFSDIAAGEQTTVVAFALAIMIDVVVLLLGLLRGDGVPTLTTRTGISARDTSDAILRADRALTIDRVLSEIESDLSLERKQEKEHQ